MRNISKTILKKLLCVNFIRSIRSYITVKREIIKCRKHHKKCIILMATPCHTNLGDHAIVNAQLKLLSQESNISPIVEITSQQYERCKKRLSKCVCNEDSIIIPGGGNLGTLWESEDNRTSEILRTYRNNRIIIFPQTCYYSSDASGQKRLLDNQKCYAAAKKLSIALRDSASYDYVRKHFPSTNALLTPDMVLYIDDMHTEYKREGCLLCLRRDKEKVLSYEEEDKIKDHLNALHIDYRYTDTHSTHGLSTATRDAELVLKFKEFAKAKLVITDRLHGMIFAAITGTPCLAIDNISKKVSGVYEWILHLDYIKLVSSNDELIENIETFLSKDNAVYDSSPIKNKYDALYSLVYND